MGAITVESIYGPDDIVMTQTPVTGRKLFMGMTCKQAERLVMDLESAIQQHKSVVKVAKEHDDYMETNK